MNILKMIGLFIVICCGAVLYCYAVILAFSYILSLMPEEPAHAPIVEPQGTAVPALCDCDEQTQGDIGWILDELVNACHTDGYFTLQYTDQDGKVGREIFYCTPSSVSDKA